MSKPFILNCLEIKDIPQINGWGVFTYETIPADTIIELSPVFTYPQKLITIAMYMAQGDGMDINDIVLDQYGMSWPDDTDEAKTAVMLGYMSIYNHSGNNNSEFFRDFKNRLMGVKTLRDINVGEQLTVNYGPYWIENKKDRINIIDF